jgi:hypothetical protein
MRALEIRSGVAEEKRPRRHQLRASAGAAVAVILKGAGDDHCHRNPRVALFEWPIVGTARTDHVLDDPAVAAREHATAQPALGAGGSPRERMVQFVRNFCQDAIPVRVVQPL